MSKKVDFHRLKQECDFCGWATKNNILCKDGATIMHGAFSDCHGKRVPIVFQHNHTDIENVLGHGYLEDRDEGTYIYGFLNDSVRGKAAKAILKHGDIESLSIFANELKRQGKAVIHGDIKEVSLVLAGANRGALIESVNIAHSDSDIADDEAIIYVDAIDNAIIHTASMEEDEDENEEESETVEETAEEENNEEATEEGEEESDNDDEVEHADEDPDSIKATLATLNDKQKLAVAALINALDTEDEEEGEDEEENEEIEHSEGGNNNMKFNAFENGKGEQQVDFLSHDDIQAIFEDAKGAVGSLKKACIMHNAVITPVDSIAHAVQDHDGHDVTYGIADIDYLYPDAHLINNEPAFIQRKMDWVSKVMSGVKHAPFGRIKSQFANITMDEARARGYIKGNRKEDEVFSLLKRTTTPQTIYKKQKLDRDDIIDIRDFNVVAWLKKEMRMMLEEEIARDILVGDGRLASSPDHVSEEHIRPIWKDDELFTVKVRVPVAANATEDDVAKAQIRAIIKARKNYKGTGTPVYFTTEDDLTDMLLLTDTTGRDLFDSVAKLATKLRVSEIITVPVMEGQTRVDNGTTYTLRGLVVNLEDYMAGTDRGGEINMFDDFDIDFNQEKYLIETRMSGALTVPYSALAVETYNASAAG